VREVLKHLWRRLWSDSETQVDAGAAGSPEPPTEDRAVPRRRHPRPRIYAIDCDERVVRTLDEAGYTITKATLGIPYRLPPAGNTAKVFMTGELRGIDEEDVILIDFASIAARTPVEANAIRSATDSSFITELPTDGIVDPRPLLASQTMGKIDRILEHGGVVIAVIGPHVHGSYAWASPQFLETGSSFSGSDVYSLLGVQAYGMNTPPAEGREVRIANESHPVSIVLARHRDSMTYAYKIEPWHRRLEFWTATATNKYGDMIAGVMVPETGGTVILIPPAGDQTAAIIRELIEQALPIIAPDVVPHLVKRVWLNELPYLTPAVAEHNSALQTLEDEHRSRRSQIEAALENARQKSTDLQNLLIATDRELVMAVHAVLHDEFGFHDIIDVDSEKRQAAGAAGDDLREDLRVPSTNPVLLFEVKGIGGRGKDSDLLQVEKAVTLHAHEQPGRTFKGVTVLNHQRHRPPLDRDYEFLRDDLVTILETKALAAITTWDLFRLAVNRQAHSWPTKALQDIFFQSGRIGAVPAHYEEIGRITQYFAKVRAAIILLSAPLQVGERIALERPVLFHEQDVTGIRLNDKEIPSAAAGVEIGIISDIPRADARPGTRVFRVNTGW
jgi:hypothetical protein